MLKIVIVGILFFVGVFGIYKVSLWGARLKLDDIIQVPSPFSSSRRARIMYWIVPILFIFVGCILAISWSYIMIIFAIVCGWIGKHKAESEMINAMAKILLKNENISHVEAKRKAKAGFKDLKWANRQM
jgi:hypothetical protein